MLVQLAVATSNCYGLTSKRGSMQRHREAAGESYLAVLL